MNAQPAAASLDSILATVQAKSPASEQVLARDFARAYLARLPEEELSLRPAAYWAGIALGALELARQRPSGQALIRVFNASAGDAIDSAHTVVQIDNDDMPFLVDSVSMLMAQHGIAMHGIVHPVFPLRRDASGQLLAIGDGAAESFMHLEIDRQADEQAMRQLRDEIARALDDVRASVADWKQMRAKMEAIADELGDRVMPVGEGQRAEAQAFLRWAADNHFTFLGYREYEVAPQNGKPMLCPVQGTGLGLMRGKDADAAPRPLTGLAAADLPAGVKMDPLILTKTNARSTVHRAGYMDYIGVLTFDKDGRAVREQRFLGLYTSSAYNRRPWDIPVVRQRFEDVMQASGLAESGHSGKALKHILETLPRDELFQASAEELTRTGLGILSLQERVRPRLFLRRDRYGRFYSALVYIPRDRFNTEIRQRIEALLMRELKGERLDTTIQIGESPLAWLHARGKLTVRRYAAGEALRRDWERISPQRAWDDVRSNVKQGFEHARRGSSSST